MLQGTLVLVQFSVVKGKSIVTNYGMPHFERDKQRKLGTGRSSLDRIKKYKWGKLYLVPQL